VRVIAAAEVGVCISLMTACMPFSNHYVNKLLKKFDKQMQFIDKQAAKQVQSVQHR
jgi:hypothetical protein